MKSKTEKLRSNNLQSLKWCGETVWGRKKLEARMPKKKYSKLISRYANTDQLFCILFMVAFVSMQLLFPPNNCTSKLYTPFWDIPKGCVDIEALIVQIACMLPVAGILFLLFKERKKPRLEQRNLKLKLLGASIIIILISTSGLLWRREGVTDTIENLLLMAFGVYIFVVLLRGRPPKSGAQQ